LMAPNESLYPCADGDRPLETQVPCDFLKTV
jgi:hypothetical protein